MTYEGERGKNNVPSSGDQELGRGKARASFNTGRARQVEKRLKHPGPERRPPPLTLSP
jgi:hypothetical protein